MYAVPVPPPVAVFVAAMPPGPAMIMLLLPSVPARLADATEFASEAVPRAVPEVMMR